MRERVGWSRGLASTVTELCHSTINGTVSHSSAFTDSDNIHWYFLTLSYTIVTGIHAFSNTLPHPTSPNRSYTPALPAQTNASPCYSSYNCTPA